MKRLHRIVSDLGQRLRRRARVGPRPTTPATHAPEAVQSVAAEPVPNVAERAIAGLSRSAGVVDLAVRATDVESIDIAKDLPETVWRSRHALRSSYMYKLHESKRRKLLLNAHGHRQRVWAYNDKPAGYQFAESVGISVPSTIIADADMASIDWSGLPARFVVKPRNGAANRGVYLLERTADGRYHDLMRGDTDDADEFRKRYADLVDRGLISPRCSVEELLVPRPELRDRINAPDDFKVYCFYDRAAVVMQRRMFGRPDLRDWKFKFWTRSWDDLGAVKYVDRCDPGLERPAGADELIAAAELAGRRLAIPFVRLDFYDTDRGIVFGEVSAHPGPPEVWAPEIDELLGREWENAEARLLAEGISPSEVVPAPEWSPT